MAKTSEVEKLLSQNPKLQELGEPFNPFYAYYLISLKLKQTLNNFLETEENYIKSLRLVARTRNPDIVHQVNPPFLLKQFFPEEGGKKGMPIAFLEVLLQGIASPKSRNLTTTFKFEKTDAVLEITKNRNDVVNLTDYAISAFFRRAEKCLKEVKQPSHSDLAFMDFISAFCGYNDFKNFLDSEFGPNYKKEEDITLQGLTQKHPIEQGQTSINTPTRKFESTTELVGKSIHKPKFLIGRDGDLEKISGILESRGIVAVIGEGGMGKTSIAAYLYHSALEQGRYSDVAWLFCEHGTMSALFETAQGLGKNLEGLKAEEKLTTIARDLKEKGEKLLLVLDNVENDLNDFFQEFQGFGGHVLITSRSSFEWEKLEEYRLPALDIEDAKTLFRTHYSEKNGIPLESGAEFEKLLDQLISAIGSNTLLIELFAKLLKQDFSDTADSKYGIKQFLEDLKKKGMSFVSGNVYISTNYSFNRRKKVATIPEILDILYDFSKLDESSRQLLVNLSLLPAQEFTREDLLELFDPTETREFRRTLSKLYSHGWIGGDGRKIVRVSPVVQEMTIRKNENTLWEDGKDLVTKISNLIQYEPEKDNVHTKFKWLPIANQITQIFKNSTDAKYFQLLELLGILFIESGGSSNLMNALESFEKVKSFDIENFGNNSPQVGITKSNLARILKDLGGTKNLTYAKQLIKETRDIIQNKTGISAELKTVINSNLAMIIKEFDGKSNLLESKDLLEEALAYTLQNYDSTKVANIRSNLALVLMDLGGKDNLERAKDELELALHSDLKNFGDLAPAVAIKRSSLAIVLLNLEGKENLERAKTELELALHSDLKNFGDLAPAVAIKRSSLAIVLLNLEGKENLEQAKTQLELALESNYKNFGDNAPTVAITRSNLAMVLKKLGGREHLEQAKNLLESALESNRKNFEDNAKTVANTRCNLALVLQDLGRKEDLLQSKTLLELALKSDLKNFGDNAQTVSTKRSHLALVLQDLGGEENLVQAKNLLELVLESDLKNFGDQAPSVAIGASNLARVLQVLGGEENLKQAKNLLEFALDSNLKNFGNNAQTVVNTRSNLAMVFKDLGERKSLKQAKNLLELALEADLENSGDQASTVQIIRSNLALVLKDLGGKVNLERSKNLLKLALKSLRKNFGEDSLQMIIPSANLAAVLHDLKGKSNLQEALVLATKAHSLSVHHLGEEHSTSTTISRILDQVKKALE